VRTIVDGIRGVVYRRLRSGEQAQLPGLVDEPIEWGLCYGEPDGDVVRRSVRAAAIPTAHSLEASGENGLDWEEPPDTRRSRAELTQRERIIRAASRVVVEHGYEALSIPAISRTAGVSNQTFYEHFGNKRDAFLAAFEVLSAEALAAGTTAFEAVGDRPEAIGAGLRAALEYTAGESSIRTSGVL
jgi:hypothetical protein